MMKNQQILIIAPYIPQVYVSLALIPELKNEFEDFTFLILTSLKYFHLFKAMKDCQLVTSLQQPQVDLKIYIGHSFFLQDQLLNDLSKIHCPGYWVNAHFEQENLDRWQNSQKLKQALHQTFTTILYENDKDNISLRKLGFNSEQLYYINNAKYDCADASHEQLLTAKKKLKNINAFGKKVITAGSITKGLESELIVRSFKELMTQYSTLKFIIAPRNLEHIDAISKQLTTHDLKFKLSSQTSTSLSTQVLLIDQIGLLKGFYHYSTITIMGRSFYSNVNGGSNIIEPAIAAQPIVIGPFMNGFKDILQNFRLENALIQLSSPIDLLTKLQNLLDNPSHAKALGLRALKVCQSHSGALHQASKILSSIQSDQQNVDNLTV